MTHAMPFPTHSPYAAPYEQAKGLLGCRFDHDGRTLIVLYNASGGHLLSRGLGKYGENYAVQEVVQDATQEELGGMNFAVCDELTWPAIPPETFFYGVIHGPVDTRPFDYENPLAYVSFPKPEPAKN